MSTRLTGRPRRPRQTGFSPVLERQLLRPFTGGLVTDPLPQELAPDQSPGPLQDAIMPRTVVSARGRPGTVGGNPFSGVSTAEWMSVMATQWYQDLANVDVVVTNNDGYIGSVLDMVNVLPAFNDPRFTGGLQAPRICRCIYRGEMLLFAPDGVSPILRLCDGIADPFQATGTVSWAGGRATLVTGVGTQFTRLTMGHYLTIGRANAPPFVHRIAKILSDTELSIAVAPAGAVGSVAGGLWTPSAVGMIGLCVEVTRLGTVATGASSSAVNGTGSSWGTAIIDNGRVAVMRAGIDLIQIDDPGAGTSQNTTQGWAIQTRTTDKALTLTDNYPAAHSGWNYSVRRPLVGTDGCVHNGSLHVIGCQWRPRTLFMLPPASPQLYDTSGNPIASGFLEDLVNGVDPVSVPAPGQTKATLAKTIDIVGPSTAGRLVSCLSGGEPGPVLIHDDRDCYGLWTIYPPGPSNSTVRRIGEGAGCVDLRSAQETAWGPVWAGPNGIHTYAGGQVLDLTKGRRGKEWVRLMEARSPNAVITAWVVRDHLGISILDPGGIGAPVTWTYDMVNKVWMGNFTTGGVRYAHSARLAGRPDEAYVVNDAVKQIATYRGLYADDGTPRGGTFIAQAPPTLLGDLAELVRPVALKAVWEADGGASTVIDVICGDGNANQDGKADSLLGDATGQVQEKRIVPITNPATPPPDGVRYGTLGRQTRTFQVRFSQTGAGTPNELRLHELVVYTRQFRTRA